MPGVLDRRLIFVVGKGGVGKTTVAASLGLLAARAGKRTLIVEVAERDRIAAAFGKPDSGGVESELASGLSVCSVDQAKVREEWLRERLRSRTLAGLVNSSRLFQYLAAAAPGLAELVTMGKIWELSQMERRSAHATPYDLVIVDAPATGHGLALLRAPRTFADIARVGPIHRQARIIEAFVTDRTKTAVLAVALPEEMPVNETIEIEARLGETMSMELEHVLVNSVLAKRFSASEVAALADLAGALDSGTGEAVATAISADRRARAQRSQVTRLRRHVHAPVATLPHLLTPKLESTALERLSRELERKL